MGPNSRSQPCSRHQDLELWPAVAVVQDVWHRHTLPSPGRANPGCFLTAERGGRKAREDFPSSNYPCPKESRGLSVRALPLRLSLPSMAAFQHPPACQAFSLLVSLPALFPAWEKRRSSSGFLISPFLVLFLFPREVRRSGRRPGR